MNITEALSILDDGAWAKITRRGWESGVFMRKVSFSEDVFGLYKVYPKGQGSPVLLTAEDLVSTDWEEFKYDWEKEGESTDGY